MAALLVTGPEGAGARPGPACYSRGGERPTITDAQLVLGRLKPGPYAGGVVSLDLGKAQDAIRTHVSDRLKMTVEDAAIGMIEIMEQHLLHAVEKISTERGHDPGRFMLVAVGGAGPMHGASVARKLGCRGVYIPRIAGVFCAIGMLNSDVRHDFSRSTTTRLTPGSLRTLAAAFEELEDAGRAVLGEEGFAPDRQDLRRELDLRHPGQQWPLSIQLPKEADDGAAAPSSKKHMNGSMVTGSPNRSSRSSTYAWSRSAWRRACRCCSIGPARMPRLRPASGPSPSSATLPRR